MRTTLDEACRNYRFSIEEGSSRLDPGNTAAGQARRYRQAMSNNRRICNRVKALLRDRTVERRMMFGYLAFAQQLDRLRRKYSSATLAFEASIQLRLWLIRGLDQVILDAIRREMLGPDSDISNHI
jgi:hypothetical protein